LKAIFVNQEIKSLRFKVLKPGALSQAMDWGKTAEKEKEREGGREEGGRE
jgi:hypothetical protein